MGTSALRSRDNGRGINRDVIATKAVERGLVTEEQAAQLSDTEVFRFIFAAGFSHGGAGQRYVRTEVSAWDVVRTNISTLGGDPSMSHSTLGEGTTIEILIPLTVAILPALMVGIGKHDYAIPVMSVIEIVRPTPELVHSVGGHPVMRLREAVLPLIDMRDRLEETSDPDDEGFAVVVKVGEKSAGLVVDRLVGQQEVVIKPLEDGYTSGGPFSGATIREDGDVSLILDIIELIRSAELPDRAAA